MLPITYSYSHTHLHELLPECISPSLETATVFTDNFSIYATSLNFQKQISGQNLTNFRSDDRSNSCLQMWCNDHGEIRRVQKRQQGLPASQCTLFLMYTELLGCSVSSVISVEIVRWTQSLSLLCDLRRWNYQEHGWQTAGRANTNTHLVHEAISTLICTDVPMLFSPANALTDQ